MLRRLKNLVPGAEQKSEAIRATLGRILEAWCQYSIYPPASLIVDVGIKGSLRYVNM